jgi:hypothetical protein
MQNGVNRCKPLQVTCMPHSFSERGNWCTRRPSGAKRSRTQRAPGGVSRKPAPTSPLTTASAAAITAPPEAALAGTRCPSRSLRSRHSASAWVKLFPLVIFAPKSSSAGVLKDGESEAQQGLISYRRCLALRRGILVPRTEPTVGKFRRPGELLLAAHLCTLSCP